MKFHICFEPSCGSLHRIPSILDQAGVIRAIEEVRRAGREVADSSL